MTNSEYSYLTRFLQHDTISWTVHSHSRVTGLRWYCYNNQYYSKPWPFALPKACPMLFLAKNYLARNKLARELANVAIAAWLSHYGPNWFCDPLLASPLIFRYAWFGGHALCPACNRGKASPRVNWWPAQAHTAVPMFREGDVTWFIFPTITWQEEGFEEQENWFEPRGISLLSAIYRCPENIRLRWLGVTESGRVLAGRTIVDALLQPEWEGPTDLTVYWAGRKEHNLHNLRMRSSPDRLSAVHLAKPTEQNLRYSEGRSICWGQIIVGLYPGAQKWQLLDYHQLGGTYA